MKQNSKGYRYLRLLPITLLMSNTVLAAEVELFKLSLEELMNVKVSTGATLLSTSLINQPAAISHISTADIQHSGAINLDDLMEIYVPSMQMLQTTFYGRTIGFRGVQLKRPEQYLLMVNGQASNFRIFDGAVNERELPLLGDIRDVSVIRGPSSFLYGPGAEMATINIATHDGFSFQGNQVTSQYNPIDNLKTLELSHGQEFDQETALYLYIGAADYNGADYKDAPVYFGHSFDSYWGPVEGGEAADHIGLGGVLGWPDHQYKVYLRYDQGNFNAWIRYTEEGIRNPETWAKLQHDEATNLPGFYGWHPTNDTADIQQLLNESNRESRKSRTAAMNYQQVINDQWSVDYNLAYHWSEYSWHRGWGTNPLEYRTNTYSDDHHTQAKALVSWEPSSNEFALAFGGEVARQPFSGERWIEGGAQVNDYGSWTTYMHSLMFDFQWGISEPLTLYAGMRADKHSYMDWMNSPRLAAVYQASHRDQLKFIAAKSVRKPMEILMRIDRLNETRDSFEPEEFESLEIRWQRQQNNKLSFNNSLVYERINVFDASLSGDQDQVGRFDIGVYEFELAHKTDTSSLIFSHSYSRLLEADQHPNVAITTLSVADAENPRGNELAFWSQHISKLAWNQNITKTINFSSSLVYYWGFDGVDDFTQWVTENSGDALPTGAHRRYGLYDGTNQDASKGSLYMNAGFQWDPAYGTSIRLDAYNINEWFNQKSSKRNYIGSGAGSYQIEPASLRLKVEFKIR